MTTDLFATILFGHFLGDYMFQPRRMAREKGKSNFVCLLHVSIYTFVMLLVLLWQGFIGYDEPVVWSFLAILFGTHYLIDRYHLADYYLQYVHGAGLRAYAGNADVKGIDGEGNIEYGIDSQDVLRGSFETIIYVVIDNGWHIFLVYWAALYLL
jgi:hypothetical protein